MKIYGDRLKQLRKENGMRQKDVAEYLHVTIQALSCWENGTREPSMEMQKKIADYFGVSIDYMMRSDEELSANSFNDKWKRNLLNKFKKVV